MADLVASPRLKGIQRTALTMLVITGSINYFDRVALAIANPLVRHDLGLSVAQMGVLLSVFLWSYAFSQLPVGAMVDRIGPRILLGGGMLLWSVAQGAAGFVTGMGQFVWTRIFLGIGESPQFPLGARVVRNWFNIRDRGTPTGIFNCASTLGPAIAPPLLTGLMLAFGWRWMFILLGIVGIIGAIVWFILYRDPPHYELDAAEQHYLSEGEDAIASGGVSFAEWRSLFGFRTTWGMILGNFGSGYMIWLYAAWLPGYLEIQRHMSIPRTGLVASVPFVFGVIGSLTGGWVCDWLVRRGMTPIGSRKLPIILGMVASAALTAIAAVTPSNTVAVGCISASMFFGNLAGATIWALAVVAAPAKGVASLGSMQNFGGFLGGALAPMVTGFVVQSTGSFVPALLIAAVIGVASALIYLFVVRDPVVLDTRLAGPAQALAE
ncbi:MAG TPA: MFS transporter [Acetobacteraceae bacterium]|nr:MFS transporter [Acetobacteraceae bacterium]